jgi:hypothetical protein
MATYVAMEPASGPAAVRTQLVPDRFVFVAFLAPVLWLLWHRLWLEAFVVLAVSFALGSLSLVPGQEGLAVVLGLLVALLIALEGGALRIAALRRRGWHEAAIIEAHDRNEAELRYVAGILPDRQVVLDAVQAPTMPARPVGGEMLGMLDYPGAR